MNGSTSEAIKHFFDPTNGKHWIDGGAVLTGIASFFKLVPWPEIAGFLSCVWLLGNMAYVVIMWIKRKWLK